MPPLDNNLNFNGVTARVVFGFWFDDFRAMSAKRLIALNGIFQKIGVPFCLLNSETVLGWEKQDAPFHSAVKYLSSVHKSDYYRAYFMHHYGGGYTDIKQPQVNWMPFFKELDKSTQKIALGYTELRPTGVAINPNFLELNIRDHYRKLIGMCSYIMRPNTELTSDYLNGVHEILDENQKVLAYFPAKSAYDNADGWFTNIKTGYPLRWTQIGSEVYHYCLLKHSDGLIQNDAICPFVTDYR
jgi:hypothetical protein